MSGAIPPLPNTPSWRGAQLKHTDNFTFTRGARRGKKEKISNQSLTTATTEVTLPAKNWSSYRVKRRVHMN
jgi:hypothetical protein